MAGGRLVGYLRSVTTGEDLDSGLPRDNLAGGRVSKALNPGPPDYSTSLRLIAGFDSVPVKDQSKDYSHSVVPLSRRREITAKNPSALTYIMSHNRG